MVCSKVLFLLYEEVTDYLEPRDVSKDNDITVPNTALAVNANIFE
ncbi:hypothetical protein GGR08_000305 [Bartonella fuyuanensis]|uniref:Uncharacterized protein n=1 Tax=Bartonella fuyuanensis TaxID=1460968 RepID=A0A840DSK1_9HYPH|nr:hypothetical protein [Bartonella fuyuanensis]MBB4076024.1 hypothetical protein [Bartonella fuyuanensis]